MPVTLAFVVSLAVSPVVLVGLRRWGVLDIPSHRSSHRHPTPRGGGIAVGIGATTALLTASSVPGRPKMGLLVAACGFGVVGLLDDLFGVPALRRLALQVVAAAAAVTWLVSTTDGPVVVQVGVNVVAIFWLVSYVNAYNFMDGINGISVVQVVVAGAVWSAIGTAQDLTVLTTFSAVVAAAALGFAPFNFPRARMFLGDAGSYFIGAWLAGAAVVGLRAGVPPEAMLAPLALYLADTGTTLLQRLRRRQSVHVAHREHAYQRLVDQGWSHERTSLFVGIVLVAVSGLGLLSLTDSLAWRVAGDAAAAGVLVLYLRLPHWLANRAPHTVPVFEQ